MILLCSFAVLSQNTDGHGWLLFHPPFLIPARCVCAVHPSISSSQDRLLGQYEMSLYMYMHNLPYLHTSVWAKLEENKLFSACLSWQLINKSWECDTCSACINQWINESMNQSINQCWIMLSAVYISTQLQFGSAVIFSHLVFCSCQNFHMPLWKFSHATVKIFTCHCEND